MRFMATLLIASLLFVCVPRAGAAVPSPANSTVPPCLVVCPGGDVVDSVTVRDIANNPILGSTVVLDFGACPAFHVCPEQPPGVIVDPSARTVRALTNPQGTATFPVRMGGLCPGGTVGVIADGVWLRTVPLASPDQDGNLVVDGGDVTHVNGLVGTHDPGADFDCDGTVTAADLAWLVDQHGGHECAVVVPARPLHWGTLKVLYR